MAETAGCSPISAFLFFYSNWIFILAHSHPDGDDVSKPLLQLGVAMRLSSGQWNESENVRWQLLGISLKWQLPHPQCPSCHLYMNVTAGAPSQTRCWSWIWRPHLLELQDRRSMGPWWTRSQQNGPKLNYLWTLFRWDRNKLLTYLRHCNLGFSVTCSWI